MSLVHFLCCYGYELLFNVSMVTSYSSCFVATKFLSTPTCCFYIKTLYDLICLFNIFMLILLTCNNNFIVNGLIGAWQGLGWSVHGYGEARYFLAA